MKTFVIDVENLDGIDRENEFVFNLGIQNSSDPGACSCPIAMGIKSIDDLKVTIDKLKQELDNILKEGEQKLNRIKKELSVKKDTEPGEIWQRMCEASEEDFFSIFNALSESKRKAVANYVLTEENIFKDRAMLFSQCFDYRAHVLIDIQAAIPGESSLRT